MRKERRETLKSGRAAETESALNWRVGSWTAHNRYVSMQAAWAVTGEDVEEKATPLCEALLCDTYTAHPSILTPIFGPE